MSIKVLFSFVIGDDGWHVKASASSADNRSGKVVKEDFNGKLSVCSISFVVNGFSINSL